MVHPVGVFTATEAAAYLTGSLALGPECGAEQGARGLAADPAWHGGPTRVS